MTPSFCLPVSAALVVAATLTLPLAGCVTGLADNNGARPHARTADWHNVAIVTGESPRRYEVLGEVSAFGDEFAKEPRMDDQLRHQAALLGADAVLVSSASHGYETRKNDGKYNSGLAIKYTGAKDS